MSNINQVAKVFRVITKFLLLEENQDALKTHGVLRECGRKDISRRIIAKILNDDADYPELSWTKTYKIHEYISAMKIMLEENDLLDQNDFSIEFQKYEIEKSDSEQGAVVLNKFIDDLAKSSSEKEHLAGEIFYSYFKLAKSVMKFKDVNDMGASNLAIILGPNFEKLLSKGDNVTEMYLLTLKLNDMCKVILENEEKEEEEETYAQDFEEKYSESIRVIKKKKVEELVSEKQGLEVQKITYLSKIEEYEGKIKEEAKELSKADRKTKKIINARIKEYKKAVAIFVKALKDETVPQLKAITSQIEVRRAEIEASLVKYPPKPLVVAATVAAPPVVVSPPVVAPLIGSRVKSEADVPGLLMSLGSELEDIKGEIDKTAPPANDAPVVPPVVITRLAPAAVAMKKREKGTSIKERLIRKK